VRLPPVVEFVLVFIVFDDGFLTKSSLFRELALDFVVFGFAVFSCYRRLELFDKIFKSKRWKNQLKITRPYGDFKTYRLYEVSLYEGSICLETG
jgi:hypothetical protein